MKKGLCLAGGGIKGAAHIGALKVFEEENIKFDCFSGTSSGSIVATLIALGYSADEMYQLFKKYAKSIKYIEWKNIFKIIYGLIVKRKLIVNGLNTGKVIEKSMKKACEIKNIENIQNIQEINKELLIPAVDADSGKVYIFNSCNIDKKTKEEIYVSKGPIPKVVRASCSYPVVFSPCEFGDTELLDGGIRENIPWRELKEIGCDKVVSINFQNKYKKKCCENIIEIAERSLELMCDELYEYEIDKIDYLHTIKSDNVSLLEVEKMDELYEQGYFQTKDKIEEIKKYLS